MKIIDGEGVIIKITPKFGFIHCRFLDMNVFFHRMHMADRTDEDALPDMTYRFAHGDKVLFDAEPQSFYNGCSLVACASSIRLLEPNLNIQRFMGYGTVTRVGVKCGIIQSNKELQLVFFNRNSLYPRTSYDIQRILRAGDLVKFSSEPQNRTFPRWRCVSVQGVGRLGPMAFHNDAKTGSSKGARSGFGEEENEEREAGVVGGDANQRAFLMECEWTSSVDRFDPEFRRAAREWQHRSLRDRERMRDSDRRHKGYERNGSGGSLNEYRSRASSSTHSEDDNTSTISLDSESDDRGAGGGKKRVMGRRTPMHISRTNLGPYAKHPFHPDNYRQGRAGRGSRDSGREPISSSLQRSNSYDSNLEDKLYSEPEDDEPRDIRAMLTNHRRCISNDGLDRNGRRDVHWFLEQDFAHNFRERSPAEIRTAGHRIPDRRSDDEYHMRRSPHRTKDKRGYNSHDNEDRYGEERRNAKKPLSSSYGNDISGKSRSYSASELLNANGVPGTDRDSSRALGRKYDGSKSKSKSKKSESGGRGKSKDDGFALSKMQKKSGDRRERGRQRSPETESSRSGSISPEECRRDAPLHAAAADATTGGNKVDSYKTISLDGMVKEIDLIVLSSGDEGDSDGEEDAEEIVDRNRREQTFVDDINESIAKLELDENELIPVVDDIIVTIANDRFRPIRRESKKKSFGRDRSLSPPAAELVDELEEQHRRELLEDEDEMNYSEQRIVRSDFERLQRDHARRQREKKLGAAKQRLASGD